jgi:hypothetical protein
LLLRFTDVYFQEDNAWEAGTSLLVRDGGSAMLHVLALAESSVQDHLLLQLNPPQIKLIKLTKSAETLCAGPIVVS